MASIFRIGVLRVANGSTPKLLSNTCNELKLSIRGISGQDLRLIKNTPKRPAPYPYHTKGFNNFTYFFDKTTARFDENSKVIVVEGPPAAGKSKLAKELAKDLDMFYLPEANLDMIYTNDYGFNLKQLDDQVPEPCRTHDVEDFLKNPRHRKSLCFQLQQYQTKFSQYVDALAHVFSTGQGVILDRCVYSDFVFIEAMRSADYVSKAAKNFYYEVRQNSISCLLRPHLVIYLDVPVPKVLSKIKNRKLACETNSSVLNEKYLHELETAYKQGYLKEISKHSELLVYDWSEEAEVEVVIEDIERINFDHYDDQSPKMKDWDFESEEEYGVARSTFADRKDDLENNFNVYNLDLPELVTTAADYKEYIDIVNESPGNKFAYGYNAGMGDNPFIKLGLKKRHTLPLIERVLK